ncbi:hypothetical protein Dimus_036689 [Dionaea muscipula]
MLVMLYKVPAFDSVDGFLRGEGLRRVGLLILMLTAARIVICDWNEGKIPYYTMPPSREQGEVPEARLVAELGKEFNVDEVYGSETSFIGRLKSAVDFQPVEVPPNPPLNFDEHMLEQGEMKPSAQNVVGDGGEDQSMAVEDEEKDEVEDKIKGKSAAARQNDKLYSAEGMLNTKIKRAEKKRRKKATRLAPSGDVVMDDDEYDYDFKVDYRKRSTVNADGDGSLVDGISGQVPMAGVKFNDE